MHPGVQLDPGQRLSAAARYPTDVPTDSFLSRFLGWFRADAAPAQALALPAPTERRWLMDGSRGDSVYNPLTHLGTAVDKGSVGRPNPWVIPLSGPELTVLYEHNGIARRIVDIVPIRACRRGWTLPDMDGENQRLRVWAQVQEAMQMARLGGGAVLLLVTEDDVPAVLRGSPAYLRTPLDPARVGRVIALQTFDFIEATPGPRWDDDPRSANFRGPAEWTLTSGTFRATVHASRTIWFRGARRQPGRIRYGSATGMPDDSCLQAIWDEIRRLTETLQGGAVMAQELRESILKMGNLGSAMVGDEASTVETQLALMNRTRSLLNMVLIGANDDFQSRSNPPTGFKELSSGAWEALAAVTGIPQVILMGSTPGGLNTDGESSWEGFRQLVSGFQESNRAELEQLYTVLYAAQDGPTGGRVPDPEDRPLEFASLDEPNATATAEIRKLQAERDVLYLDRNVIAPEDVQRARFGPNGWTDEIVATADPDEDEIARQVAERAGRPGLAVVE